MFATIRRYDGVDQNRSAELTRQVNETLVPKLEKLSGFAGYWLIEADNGVFSSLSLFETPEQSKESTKSRRQLDSRREARDDDPQRAEDHERHGRRSQRPRPGRRVVRDSIDAAFGPTPNLTKNLTKAGSRGSERAEPLDWIHRNGLFKPFTVMERAGLEPATPSLQSWCSPN